MQKGRSLGPRAIVSPGSVILVIKDQVFRFVSVALLMYNIIFINHSDNKL